MLTVMLVLVLVAIVIAAANAIGKAPLWPAVFILCVMELLRTVPLGR